MHEKLYYLVQNGKPAGPFSVDELRGRRLHAGDFVKTEDMDDFRQISEMRELSALLSLNFTGTLPQYFAGIDQRMLASVIDWLIVFGVWIVGAVVLALVTGSDQQQLVIVLGGWFLLMLPARMIYAILMESSARQATWGKKMLVIKVTDEAGNRISGRQSVLRNLAKILSTLPCFLGYILGFFNARQQCLHDSLAHTLVIKDRLL